MYCKNCGNSMEPTAAICVRCGFAAGTGVSFCPNCGQPTAPGAAACVSCGHNLAAVASANAKSKLVAGLLGIFLGALGIHHFYLGNTQKAITHILISVLGFCIAIGPIVSWLWGICEGIMILTGKINQDATGTPLKD